MDFVTIDFETANNSEIGSICSIGAIKVRKNTIIDHYFMLINPQIEFSYYNSKVHGIYAEDVINAPTFSQAWPSFRSFIGDYIVVAHNASYDIAALEKALFINDLPAEDLPYACSMCIAKQIFPNEQKHTLDALCEKFNISLKHHDALSDAEACAKLVLIFAIIQGSETIENLIQACSIPSSTTLTNSYEPNEHVSKAPKLNSYIYLLDDKKNDFAEFKLLANNYFSRKTVVLTGNLHHIARAAAQELINEMGGVCTSSVSRKTNILIVGEQDLSLVKNGKSTKQVKAEELIVAGYPIKILDEWSFYAALYGEQAIDTLRVKAVGV